MAARKNVRSTTRQIEMLVDYMSTHTHFANGEYRGPLGKEDHDEEWVRIQQLLKEYGPNKTVEQWRTTWRDLKKKARADGARANAARAITGNNTPIPSLSDATVKILNIIGTESAYGMAGQSETILGEILVTQPPPDTSPILPEPEIIIPVSVELPPSTPSTTILPTIPSTFSFTDQPSVPTTATQPTRGQRARSVKNDFLASDADTRNVLIEISNTLKIKKNKIEEKKMRRNHLDRLHKLRREKTENMGPNCN